MSQGNEHRLTFLSLCEYTQSPAPPWEYSPVEKALATGIDEPFAQQVDDFIKKYRPALEALAK